MFFQSPSGDIGCVISDEDVRCDVQNSTFEPPPKPADCDLDWGSALVVQPDKRGEFLCHGDAAMNASAEKLEYGHSTRLGPFVCGSSQSGMTCTHEPSDHGFTVSKASYRLF